MAEELKTKLENQKANLVKLFDEKVAKKQKLEIERNTLNSELGKIQQEIFAIQNQHAVVVDILEFKGEKLEEPPKQKPKKTTPSGKK